MDQAHRQQNLITFLETNVSSLQKIQSQSIYNILSCPAKKHNFLHLV